jgi:hypothetical protein
MSENNTMSAEESRLEMKRRFDALNKAEESRRNIRRGVDTAKQIEENKRWLRPDAVAAPTKEVGENDSLGG